MVTNVMNINEARSVLGISPAARVTAHTVRRAYRLRALQLHPDRHHRRRRSADSTDHSHSHSGSNSNSNSNASSSRMSVEGGEEEQDDGGEEFKRLANAYALLQQHLRGNFPEHDDQQQQGSSSSPSGSSSSSHHQQQPESHQQQPESHQHHHHQQPESHQHHHHQQQQRGQIQNDETVERLYSNLFNSPTIAKLWAEHHAKSKFSGSEETLSDAAALRRAAAAADAARTAALTEHNLRVHQQPRPQASWPHPAKPMQMPVSIPMSMPLSMAVASGTTKDSTPASSQGYYRGGGGDGAAPQAQQAQQFQCFCAHQQNPQRMPQTMASKAASVATTGTARSITHDSPAMIAAAGPAAAVDIAPSTPTTTDFIPVPFTITLEEVFHGVVKEVCAPGSTAMKLRIPRGTAPDARFRHPDRKHVFVLRYAPHPLYKVDGPHIVHDRTLSLREALLGTAFTLALLDGTHLRVDKTGQVVAPGTTHIVRGAGFRNARDTARGSLVVRFRVVFPDALSPEQRRVAEEAFRETDAQQPAPGRAAAASVSHTSASTALAQGTVTSAASDTTATQHNYGAVQS